MAGDLVAKVLRPGLAIASLLAIALLSVPVVRHLRERPPSPPPSFRFSLAPPRGAELGSGDESLDAAISPDERQIVFVATKDGTAQLWRRGLESDRAEPITGTEGARLPAWKPTGNVIAFFSGEQLKQIALADGAVRDLAAVSSPAGASWLPDGSLLFASGTRTAIRRLHENTSTDITRLRDGDRSHVFPVALGRGQAFVYTAVLDDGRREVRLVADGQERDLAMTSGHGQIVGNALLYARDEVLLGQRLDPVTKQPVGRATPLAFEVGSGVSGGTLFAASPRLLISAARTPRLRQLTWFTMDGARETKTHDPGDYWQVRLSPDDRYAAVTVTTPLLRTLDVALISIAEGANAEPLTRAVAADSDPVWSPDGRRVTFRSMQDGTPKLFSRAAHDEDAEDEAMPMAQTDETPTDWHDERIFAHAPSARGDFDVRTIVATTGVRAPTVTSQFNDTDARMSPDGRWMAYVSDESGAADVYAIPWPRGNRVRVSFAGGTRPRWGRNGRSLFFLRGSQIMRADLVSSSSFGTARTVLDVPGVRDFDVAHRRDALIALLPAAAASTPAPAVLVDWISTLPNPQP